jgi:hypothetical protein
VAKGPEIDVAARSVAKMRKNLLAVVGGEGAEMDVAARSVAKMRENLLAVVV